jgi:hypothetical protein
MASNVPPSDYVHRAFFTPVQSAPQSPKPLVPHSAMYNGASAVAVHQQPAAPAAAGLIGIGAIILKTPLGLRIIKLRPTGGAFASGKVFRLPATRTLFTATDQPMLRFAWVTSFHKSKVFEANPTTTQLKS